MKMSIQHQLNIQEAKERMEKLLGSVIKKSNKSSKVTLRNPHQMFCGNKMEFSLEAKKGMWPAVTIVGEVLVNINNVELDIKLPSMVGQKDEENLRNFIEEETKELLK